MKTCTATHIIGRIRWVCCLHLKGHAPNKHYFVKAVA